MLQLEQHDDELVAAHSRHRVGVPHSAFDAPSDRLQQLVTGLMAHGIVDVLESIQVQEEYRQPETAAMGEFDQLLQSMKQERTVRQIRQPIVLGEIPQPVLSRFALRDIREDTDVM